MTTTTTAGATSGLAALKTGTWNIDPSHSQLAFSVRHLMVSKVRGHFERFAGTLEITDDLLQSSVTADIELASVNTNDAGRDGHLRSGDFFDVDSHPTMRYRSTGLRPVGDDFALIGELSLHGVTRPVELALEFNGAGGDPWGGTRAGFTATGEINRRDFGIDISMPLDGGGVVVGEKISITLDIEAVLQQAAG